MLDAFLEAAGPDIARRPNDRWRQAALLGLCVALTPDDPGRERLARVLQALDWPEQVRGLVTADDPRPWCRWWAVLAAGQTGRIGHLRSALALARGVDVTTPDDREVARRLADLEAEMAALAGATDETASAARFTMLGHRARPDRRVLVGGRSSATYLLDPGWDSLRLVRLGPSEGTSSGNGAHLAVDEVLGLVRRGDAGRGLSVPADVAPGPDPEAFIGALKEGSETRDRELLQLAAEVREERKQIAEERVRLAREREALMADQARVRRARSATGPRSAPPVSDADVPSTAQAAAALLGVPAAASPPEVERAYRALVAGVHPDRVADLDPRIQARAAELTVAINAARDLLLGRAKPARRRG